MQLDRSLFIKQYKENLIQLLNKLPEEKLQESLEILWTAYESDKQIFFCGNGGSAAASSHIAEDVAKGSMGPKADLPIRPVRAISLTDNTPYITAWANDTGYENIFVGQLKVLLNPGDVVVGISGSGNSPNVVNAIQFAKKRGNPTVAFVGFEGGTMKKDADVVVHITSSHYGQLEDLHMIMGHVVAYWFQSRLVESYRQSNKDTLPQQK